MYLLFNIIAFCAGAIIGVVLTACIVAADWHEKPRRHRGWWIEEGTDYFKCSKCGYQSYMYKGELPYCPCCGAEMRGVRNSGNCDS